MKISVVGMGKIGLPLAAQFADKGHHVIGVDVNARTVASINASTAPFPGEAQLDEYLSRLVPAGNLHATQSFADAIPGSDVVVVVVPLFVDADGIPEFAWIDSATQNIASHLTRDTLVSYETTLPVGTTRTRWKPALETGSGLTEGVDFHVAFSPERVLTGRVFQDLRKYPKLVGGLSDAGAKAAVSFYEEVLDFYERPDLERGNGVWDLGSAEAAELAKLAETTYRDVNIGLANQFALFAERSGIDIHQVIDACNSQPFSHIHRPGISVGGHCIPIYPRLYLGNDDSATLVREARAVNSAMPALAVRRLAEAYGDLRNARVVVLGAAYRGGVKETAFSGAFDVVNALQDAGAAVTVHDPMFSADELRALGLRPHRLGSRVDAAVLHTDHHQYKQIGITQLPGVRMVLDGRGVLDPSAMPGVVLLRLGVA